jgi:hypothetical protein
MQLRTSIYSYPRVAVIGINVHPTGGNPDQHATHFLCSICIKFLDRTSHVVRVGNLSLVPTRMKYAPTPKRSRGDQRQSGPAVILDHLIPPPSRQPWSRGERFWLSGYTATSAYWVHITSMRSVHSILAHGYQPLGP